MERYMDTPAYSDGMPIAELRKGFASRLQLQEVAPSDRAPVSALLTNERVHVSPCGELVHGNGSVVRGGMNEAPCGDQAITALLNRVNEASPQKFLM